MNLHELSLRIENSSLLVSNDIPILQDLTKKYPYSQLLSILYLKTLAKDQALELEEEVGKHAYKITDRGRLFEILNEKEEVEIVKEIFDEIHFDNYDSQIESSKIIELKNHPENRDEITNDFDLYPLNSIEERNEKALDLEIISNAISGVFEKEFEPERNNEKTNQISDLEDKPEEIIEKKLIIKTYKGSKLGFSSWLRAGSTTEVKSEKNEKFDQIIDTFIQDDPKISQPKKEFYSPIKQAKKSLESENIQYTETLANILGIQGNYPKAILAYEQLCLTIPEKKTFFVQKIKELKEKLNS